MRFTHFSDVRSFYREAFEVLMRHEAQNLIPLGNVIIGYEGKDKTGWRDPANWFMATVSDISGVLLTAIMTPPHNLTLYATDNRYDTGTLTCLINGIAETGFTVNGVTTDNTLAEDFARLFAEKHGVEYAINKSQRIYELLEVNPEIPRFGDLRIAKDSDMSFLPYWCEGFNNDCFGSSPLVQNDEEQYRYHITSEKLYILEHEGMPVSMAKITREMPTVGGVGFVYTPPYFRGKGYATSCVTMLSRLILERGFTRCVLYTDLENPTSNSIYQKIGYRPICDSLEIRFK